MREKIASAIRHARDEMITNNEAPSYFEINNGLCENLTLDVLSQLGFPDYLYDMENGNFQNQEGGWDWNLLSEGWGIDAPKGLSPDEVDKIDFGTHIFIVDGVVKQFYDAECPDGVSSLFELPLFRRSIVHALRLKGIAADEVMPEDVVPAPLCPVKNPIIKEGEYSPGM